MDRIAREAAPDDTGWLQLQTQFAYLRGDMKKFRSLNEAEVNIETRGGQAQDAADDLAARAQLESSSRKLRLGAQPLSPFLGGGHRQHYRAVALCRSIRGRRRFHPRGSTGGESQPHRSRKHHRTESSSAADSFHHRSPARKPLGSRRFVGPARIYRHTLDVPYRLGQAYLAANESAKAAAQFRMVLDARDAGWWQVYAPLAQLGLARAYAAQSIRRRPAKPTMISFQLGKMPTQLSRYFIKPKPNTENSPQLLLSPLQRQKKDNNLRFPNLFSFWSCFAVAVPRTSIHQSPCFGLSTR